MRDEFVPSIVSSQLMASRAALNIVFGLLQQEEEEEEEESTDELPGLVRKESSSKAVGAFVVANRRECEYTARRGAQGMIKVLGYSRICSNGDQEPALRTIMHRMKMLSGEQFAIDETPVGDSQSNGDVESAMQQIQGQFRTMRSDLETSMPWLSRHSLGTVARE